MIKGFGASFLSTGIYLACVTKLFPDLGVFYATLIGFGLRWRLSRRIGVH